MLWPINRFNMPLHHHPTKRDTLCHICPPNFLKSQDLMVFQKSSEVEVIRMAGEMMFQRRTATEICKVAFSEWKGRQRESLLPDFIGWVDTIGTRQHEFKKKKKIPRCKLAQYDPLWKWRENLPWVRLFVRQSHHPALLGLSFSLFFPIYIFSGFKY